MKSKAYSYIRFSTAEQAKGRSEKRQMEECEAYCRDHPELTLMTAPEYTFTDRGRSGFKGHHLDDTGQLRRFLKLVENGTVEAGSTLLIESLDRLSRQQVSKALELFLGLLNQGITIVALGDNKRVYQGYDENAKQDPIGLITSILEMSRAHGESQRKSETLRDVFKDKREAAYTSKKPMGRVCPMWLRLKKDKSGYEPIPERVEIVERIFSLTIAGYGKNSIAKMLNADGVPPAKANQGVKGWGTSAVDGVVHNRSVLGEYQPHTRTLDPKGKRRDPIGDPIPNYFPAIIPEATFHEAQGAIAGRRVASATKQSVKFNVWQGIAKCVHCGSAMHMVNKGHKPKGKTYIECAVGRKGLCESHKLIRLDHAERVFRLMLARLDSMALVKDSGAKLSKELAVVEGKLIEKRSKLAQYRKFMEAEPSPTLAKMLADADAEVDRLERERLRVLGELAAEDAIGFDTFMQRLDLDSWDGRGRANALLKRLGVVAFAGQDGFIATEQGQILFGVGQRDGEVGYFDCRPTMFRKAKAGDALHVQALKALKARSALQFVSPVQAGRLAYDVESDADQARQDAQEDEGTPLIDDEAEVLLTALAGEEPEPARRRHKAKKT